MSSDSASPWAKDGVAGQIQPARRAAPDWANDLQILSVAYVAYHDDRDPADVWQEVDR